MPERLDRAFERARSCFASSNPPNQLDDLLRLVKGRTQPHPPRIALRDNEHIVLSSIGDINYFVAEGETVFARLNDRRLLGKRTLRELESRFETEPFFRANLAVLRNLDPRSQIHPCV